MNLNIIEAYTHTDNQSSRKLLEDNNFELVVGKKDEHNQTIIQVQFHNNQYQVIDNLQKTSYLRTHKN